MNHPAILQENALEHCTLPLGLPDEAGEGAPYPGANDHGLAVCDLRLSRSGLDLFDALDAAVEQAPDFKQLCAIETGFWPIALMACRHFRLRAHTVIVSARRPRCRS